MKTIAIILTALLLGTFGVAHADGGSSPQDAQSNQASSYNH